MSDCEGRPERGPHHHLWCFVRQWRTTHALWIALALVAIASFAAGSARDHYIALSALGLALLPAAIEGLSGIRLPRGFVLACGVFTVLTITLGELADFYQRVAWWDVAMHAASGFVVGGIGLVGALTLLAHLGIRRAILLPGLFAFFTALGVAGAWELFEYLLDARYGFSTQQDLADTMHDIALGGAGGALAAFWGIMHLRGRGGAPFGRLIDGAVAENAPYP